ncbi:glycosyltransferase family 4 protein [Bradyrhizobium sp. 2TAF24]|uniref:glycosyltransferase family 4 protein n=1 Tax=Bradyrhizobium sp. 2TAF24 TaxID=3233011 RepID=UPI003F8FBB54
MTTPLHDRAGATDAPGALRVCHIVATTEGAVWVFEQLRDLRDRFGHDVTVILNGRKGKLVDRFEAAGIRVLDSDFEFLNSADLLALPKKIWALARILRRERFDVVQTHLFHSMVIGRLAAWLADVPVRLAMIAGPFHLEAYTPRWIDGSTQWMETALIPSCEFSRTLYRSMGVADRRLHVIYYGPDDSKFDPAGHVAADLRGDYGWPADTPLIGMVAYFYPELGVNRWTPPVAQGRSIKSQAELIQAMPAILAQHPNAKLLLIGSGWEEGGRAYLAKMEALVASLGLGNSIKFTGFRTDIPAVLKGLDVAVQASVSENLGGTIEGLLMECPMVATRCGGLVDSVIDGRTGVLVTPSDPADLARGIVTLLRDRDTARQLGGNGRQLMLEKFTLRRTVDALDALYRSRAAKAGAGYWLPRSAWRAFAGCFVCAYLAGRYWFVDLRLLPALDAGWRPWHLSRLRVLAARLKYTLRRFATAQAETAAPAAHDVPHNEQFTSVAVAPRVVVADPPKADPFAGLKTAARMRLYRFYAFVGRLKLGWGLRQRASDMMKGTLRRLAPPWNSASPDAQDALGNAPFRTMATPRRIVMAHPPKVDPFAGLKTAARMRLYRFYAFVGRRKLGWGLRRRAKDMVRRTLRL